MQTTTLLLLGLVLVASAWNRAPRRIKPGSIQHLEGWQKVVGLVAVFLAVLIIINPEFLALGLLGDSAFFDLLVLLLSLQLQMIGAQAWHSVQAMPSKLLRLMVLRMNWDFCLILLALAPIGNVISAIRKALERNCAFACA